MCHGRALFSSRTCLATVAAAAMSAKAPHVTFASLPPIRTPSRPTTASLSRPPSSSPRRLSVAATSPSTLTPTSLERRASLTSRPKTPDMSDPRTFSAQIRRVNYKAQVARTSIMQIGEDDDSSDIFSLNDLEEDLEPAIADAQQTRRRFSITRTSLSASPGSLVGGVSLPSVLASASGGGHRCEKTGLPMLCNSCRSCDVESNCRLARSIMAFSIQHTDIILPLLSRLAPQSKLTIERLLEPLARRDITHTPAPFTKQPLPDISPSGRRRASIVATCGCARYQLSHFHGHFTIALPPEYTALQQWFRSTDERARVAVINEMIKLARPESISQLSERIKSITSEPGKRLALTLFHSYAY